MDMKTVGLIGAVAGLATIGVAHAAIPPAPGASDALAVSSYADLLAPVPDAVTQVKADDAARARRPTPEGELQLAEYYEYNNGPSPAYHHHHHHHHHHHQAYRHHHHHHHNTVVGIPGVGGVVVGNRDR